MLQCILRVVPSNVDLCMKFYIWITYNVSNSMWLFLEKPVILLATNEMNKQNTSHMASQCLGTWAHN